MRSFSFLSLRFMPAILMTGRIVTATFLDRFADRREELTDESSYLPSTRFPLARRRWPRRRRASVSAGPRRPARRLFRGEGQARIQRRPAPQGEGEARRAAVHVRRRQSGG